MFGRDDGMRTGRTNFRLILSALAAAMINACGEGDEQSDQTIAPPLQDQAPASPEVEDTDSAPAPLAAKAIRQANFYDLEWNGDSILCSAAFAALNEPYAPAAEKTSPSNSNRDYASLQARRYLGTQRNVDWRWREVSSTGGGESEVSEFDYFNDGVKRQVVRMRGKLSGNNIVGLSILENDGAEFTQLSFGYAGAAVTNLPDQENLHTKLTYSVADVIRLGGNYYTLLMPLEDVDPSGRVYLTDWRPKDGTQSPRSVLDFYPAIACVFLPADAQSADAQ